MRVGILTMYYDNYSYGGLLQAYALQQIVTGMGYECEQITYDYNERFRKKSVDSPNMIDKAKRLRRELINRKFQKILGRHNDRTKHIYREFMEFIPHSKIYSSDNLSEIKNKYDAFIVGGDQVWNMDYCDEYFFLPMVDSEKKISYSASVGKDALTDDEIEVLSKGINSFRRVSVREDSFRKIIDPVIDNEVELVIDPVFLPSRQFWDELKVSSIIDGRYTLLYLLGYDVEEKKRAIKLAKKIGLPVVFIPFANVGYCKDEEKTGDYQVWNVGPREFLGLIDGADYILTDSFHATAFSIILEKNFYCFSRPNKGFLMNSRINSLLEMSGLVERYVDLKDLKRVNVKNIDYDLCRDGIYSFRKKSLEWLNQALTQMERV